MFIQRSPLGLAHHSEPPDPAKQHFTIAQRVHDLFRVKWRYA
jgi:hypothetical protein